MENAIENYEKLYKNLYGSFQNRLLQLKEKHTDTLYSASHTTPLKLKRFKLGVLLELLFLLLLIVCGKQYFSIVFSALLINLVFLTIQRRDLTKTVAKDRKEIEDCLMEQENLYRSFLAIWDTQSSRYLAQFPSDTADALRDFFDKAHGEEVGHLTKFLHELESYPELLP